MSIKVIQPLGDYICATAGYDKGHTLEDYTEFILDAKHKETWETLIDSEEPEMKDRLEKVRRESAHCVWFMEKYRAMTLINSNDMPADYFKNVEGCIEEEFGNFTINRDSRVLLIGVGAFPMTPLLIAKTRGQRLKLIQKVTWSCHLPKKQLISSLLRPYQRSWIFFRICIH